MAKHYRCMQCDYISDRKYNVIKHTSLVHLDTKTLYICPYCKTECSTQSSLNRHQNRYCLALSQNVNQNPQNVNQNPQNVNFITESDNSAQLIKDHICSMCNKIFKRIDNYKRHMDGKCKGVASAYECPQCHKNFNTRQAKNKHLKACTVILSSVEPTSEVNNIIHTTNNTINNSFNTTTNNTINIHADVIVYNDKFLVLQDDHIQINDLKRIFHGASVQTIQAIANYALKLLENPNNRCIKKRHITNSYCEVHTGDGKWIIRPDKNVVKRFSQDVACSATDKLYNHPDIGSTKIRTEINNLASYDTEIDKNKDLVREVRSVLVQAAKDAG